MNEQELKACPHCGGSDLMHSQSGVFCKNTECEAGIDFGHFIGGTEEEEEFCRSTVAAAWNRRTEPEFEPTWAAKEARMTDKPKHDWVVHLTGPDDVFPQPDELTALREANALNKVIANTERHEYDPICFALVKDQAVEAV